MTILILIKIAVTIGFVLALSVIAERVSPRWAGILSGYPTGTAITLFFFGLEIGPQFAADSVTYNIAGLIATFCFSYTYYQASKRYHIIPTVLLALSVYLSTAVALHFVPLNKATAVVLAVFGIILFRQLFSPIKDAVITERIKLNLPVLLARGVTAATIVLLITGAAHIIGPVWSGLFSSAPTTLLPLILIVHLTYSQLHAHTIIKHTPIGNGAIIFYSLSVAFTYPLYGIYIGTVLAFVVATIYLVIYQIIQKSLKATVWQTFYFYDKVKRMNNTTLLLSQKCQVVIPRSIRQQLKLKPGMRVSIQAIDDKSAIITTQPEDYVEALSGLGAETWKKLGGVNYINKLRKEWDK